MSQRTINVIVTGGGAYDEFDYNTAADIRDCLPSIISRTGKPDIRIFRYPVDTPCTYDFGIQTMDEIWSGKAVGAGETMPTQCVDLALHMGMRPSYPGYCLETRARKNVYKQVGEDGKGFDDSMVQAEGPWANLPDCLYSSFDMEAVKDSLVRMMPDLNIKVSHDAGAYFCEFELWSSLANALLKHQSRDAIFLHVPSSRSVSSIETGAKVAVGIIEAVVDEINSRHEEA